MRNIVGMRVFLKPYNEVEHHHGILKNQWAFLASNVSIVLDARESGDILIEDKQNRSWILYKDDVIIDFSQFNSYWEYYYFGKDLCILEKELECLNSFNKKNDSKRIEAINKYLNQ